MRRIGMAVLVCWLVGQLLSSIPPAAATPANPCPDQIEKVGGGWTKIKVPEFAQLVPSGLLGRTDSVTSYTVDPIDPKTMFVSNLTSVLATHDGGCTWEKAFSLHDLPPTGPTVPCDAGDAYFAVHFLGVPVCGSIYSVTVGPTSETHERVYVQVEVHQSTLVPTPREKFAHTTWVFASDDGGRTFSLRSDATTTGGVESTWGLGELVIAPSDADTIYAGRGDVTKDDVFVSHDAGAAWSKLQTPTPALNGHSPRSLAVDPVDPKHLWDIFTTVGSAQQPVVNVYRSSDAGASWDQVEVPMDTRVGRGPSDIAVTRTKKGLFRVAVLGLAGEGAFGKVLVSDDLGASWKELPTFPDFAYGDALVFGRSADELFAVGAHAVARYNLRRSMATFLKRGTWTGDPTNDRQRFAHYVPGHGLSLVMSYTNNTDHVAIFRYGR